MIPILTVTLTSELDVIASRRRAREIAAFCAFSRQDQTRISTAVSELARHACGAGGSVRFLVTKETGRQSLVVVVQSRSPVGLDSITRRDDSLAAGDVLVSAATRRFIERCGLTADSHGAQVTLRMPFPAHTRHLDVDALCHAIRNFDALPASVALSDVTLQNRLLSDVLADLQAKQVELLRVSKELEETNKTVETLNRLLGEKAESLLVANQRKDAFLSTLSHELRGPLSATLMGAQLLHRYPADPARINDVSQLITRQASHMSRLVEDLLDVSRISRGLISIEKRRVDMREAVEVAVEQLTPALQRKKHVIQVTIPQHACMVDGDRTRLIQIIGNLLGNAIRYTPDAGHIQVVLQLHGTSLGVEVADDGIGISSDLMPKLFDLYMQGEPSSSARTGGLGLGLNLVRSLVEIHHGTVSATSAGVGKGSAFHVMLPLAAGTADMSTQVAGTV
jgi:signal transduction histidine kinase